MLVEARRHVRFCPIVQLRRLAFYDFALWVLALQACHVDEAGQRLLTGDYVLAGLLNDVKLVALSRSVLVCHCALELGATTTEFLPEVSLAPNTVVLSRFVWRHRVLRQLSQTFLTAFFCAFLHACVVLMDLLGALFRRGLICWELASELLLARDRDDLILRHEVHLDASE